MGVLSLLEKAVVFLGFVPDLVPESRTDDVVRDGAIAAIRALIAMLRRRGFEESLAVLRTVAEDDARTLDVDDIVQRARADIQAGAQG